MFCARCKNKAEITLEYPKLNLCGHCFAEFYERKVKETVERYHLIEKNDRILVGVSGGKDSGSLLFVLPKVFPDRYISALYLNLGISGYSDECEGKVRELAKMTDTELI
jgi:tRNA(Ile)-lysidine synthase TilS/MesJ